MAPKSGFFVVTLPVSASKTSFLDLSTVVPSPAADLANCPGTATFLTLSLLNGTNLVILPRAIVLPSSRRVNLPSAAKSLHFSTGIGFLD